MFFFSIFFQLKKHQNVKFTSNIDLRKQDFLSRENNLCFALTFIIILKSSSINIFQNEAYALTGLDCGVAEPVLSDYISGTRKETTFFKKRIF